MTGKKTDLDGQMFEGEYWYVDPGKAGRDRAPIRETAAAPDPESGEGVPAASSENEDASAAGEGKTPNPNAGHRGRLRERFRENQDFEGFSDHEILELLLTYGSPRKDTKAMAKSLLGAFGTLKGVFEAMPQQLMQVEGIGEVQATLVSMMLPLTRILLECEMASPKQINNRRDLEYHCKGLLLGKRIEEFWVVCVNAQCRILGERRISTGSLSEVSAYPRLVMETVMAYNAHSVFFCHNHPGGTCAPSAEDISSTLQLQRLLSGVDVILLDHMIIAGTKSYSMAERGDIEFGARGRRI